LPSPLRHRPAARPRAGSPLLSVLRAPVHGIGEAVRGRSGARPGGASWWRGERSAAARLGNRVPIPRTELDTGVDACPCRGWRRREDALPLLPTASGPFPAAQRVAAVRRARPMRASALPLSKLSLPAMKSSPVAPFIGHHRPGLSSSLLVQEQR